MTITTPPLPAPTPAQQKMLQDFQQEQNQKQNQSQDDNINNNFTPTDSSTANSVSDSENVVSQSGSLLNIQQNNSFDTFFRYSNGTHVPTATFNINATALPNNKFIATAGVVIPLGGKSKKLAHREVDLHAVAREASVCTGLINADIDVSEVESLSFCSKYKKVVKVAKVDLQDSLKLLKEQQRTIEALQLRLIQIQNTPTPVRGTY